MAAIGRMNSSNVPEKPRKFRIVGKKVLSASPVLDSPMHSLSKTLQPTLITDSVTQNTANTHLVDTTIPLDTSPRQGRVVDDPESIIAAIRKRYGLSTSVESPTRRLVDAFNNPSSTQVDLFGSGKLISSRKELSPSRQLKKPPHVALTAWGSCNSHIHNDTGMQSASGTPVPPSYNADDCVVSSLLNTPTSTHRNISPNRKSSFNQHMNDPISPLMDIYSRASTPSDLSSQTGNYSDSHHRNTMDFIQAVVNERMFQPRASPIKQEPPFVMSAAGTTLAAITSSESYQSLESTHNSNQISSVSHRASPELTLEQLQPLQQPEDEVTTSNDMKIIAAEKNGSSNDAREAVHIAVDTSDLHSVNTVATQQSPSYHSIGTQHMVAHKIPSRNQLTDTDDLTQVTNTGVQSTSYSGCNASTQTAPLSTFLEVAVNTDIVWVKGSNPFDIDVQKSSSPRQISSTNPFVNMADTVNQAEYLNPFVEHSQNQVAAKHLKEQIDRVKAELLDVNAEIRLLTRTSPARKQASNMTAFKERYL